MKLERNQLFKQFVVRHGLSVSETDLATKTDKVREFLTNVDLIKELATEWLAEVEACAFQIGDAVLYNGTNMLVHRINRSSNGIEMLHSSVTLIDAYGELIDRVQFEDLQKV